jgi:succinate-semialdehyde dehydrogenase/glutarate-semialdehyde dehydrogenase
MENTGQACNGAKRMIVHEDLYDDFVAKFTERILASATAPLSSQAAAERLEQQVNHALEEGAHLATAGKREGAHFPAGVLTDVDRDSATYREELFGPVAMVFKVGDEAEAVELANDTAYGLGSYVYTTDADQAARVADQLDTGMVFVNGVGIEGAELPFGGVKRSGFGRELGRLGIDEFINKKLIRTAG